MKIARSVVTFFCAACGGVDGATFLNVGISEDEMQAALVKDISVVEHVTNQSNATLKRLQRLQDGLTTMFLALPRDEEGRLSHAAVRYALHRYFAHAHGWFIRGLEPTPDGEAGAKTSKEWQVGFLQDEFERLTQHNRSDLAHVAAFGLAVEDLIRIEVAGWLEVAYKMHGFPPKADLSFEQAKDLLNTYYVAFLNSGQFSASTPEDVHKKIERFWTKYERAEDAKVWLNKFLKDHISETVSFESLKDVAFAIGEEYVVFNEFECEDMKKTLRSVQGKPGRVRLSAFYLKGQHTHWAFSEKIDYLRALGALDESDPTQPSVIIANYAMSRSNCLDVSKLYTICCINECEELLRNIESVIDAPTASVRHIDVVLRSMSASTIGPLGKIPDHLHKRLEEIAAQNEGVIPLHGRLFAQWLHHAYPQNCPYPHETGSINPETPDEWMKETGAGVSAAEDEIKAHIESDTCSIDEQGKVDCGDERVTDLPWSSKEELLTLHPHKFVPAGKPQVRSGRTTFFVCAALASCALAAWVAFQAKLCGVKGNLLLAGVAWRPLVATGFLAVIAYLFDLLDPSLLVLSLVFGVVVSIVRQVSYWKNRVQKCSGDETVKSLV